MSIESCATDVFLNHISKLVMCVSLTTLPEKLKNNKKKQLEWYFVSKQNVHKDVFKQTKA